MTFSRIILGTKQHSGLILYVNKIDGYQYDSSASNGYGTYCRFRGGCKKSLQNMSLKLTKLICHFATRRDSSQARLFCDSRLHRCSYPTVTNRALPESASISLPRSSERSAQRCASCSARDNSSPSVIRFATRNSGIPDWRVPAISPGPGSWRSTSARRNPSVLEAM